MRGTLDALLARGHFQMAGNTDASQETAQSASGVVFGRVEFNRASLGLSLLARLLDLALSFLTQVLDFVLHVVGRTPSGVEIRQFGRRAPLLGDISIDRLSKGRPRRENTA